MLDGDGLLVVQRGAEVVEFLLKAVERAQNLLAVFERDGFPKCRVSRSDAGGIAQAWPGERQPFRVTRAEIRAKGGSQQMGKMTQMCDDFVMRFGRRRGNFAAQGLPKTDEAIDVLGFGIHERSDKTGAVLKKFGICVFEARFFRAGHGMRTDERDFLGQRGPALPANEAFGRANVRDQGAGF